MSLSNYLLNALVLENGSLLVRQIQGHPIEAISSAGTVDERKRAELYNRTRHAASKDIHSHEKHQILTYRASKGRSTGRFAKNTFFFLHALLLANYYDNISPIHICSCIQEHFRHAPFHTCYVNARIARATDKSSRWQ